jgi:hypothetical protein
MGGTGAVGGMLSDSGFGRAPPAQAASSSAAAATENT